MSSKPTKTATEVVDALLEQVVDEETVQGASSSPSAWARSLQGDVTKQLDALRRGNLPIRPELRRAVNIPTQLRLESREALLARIESLRQAGLVVAHKHLSGLTDDDLRQLLAEVEASERSRS